MRFLITITVLTKIMVCEICGKEHDGLYGSGRFCSSHCKHVYAGRQTKIHVCNFNKNGNKKAYKNWKCERCNLIFNTRKELYEHKHQFHPIPKGSSWNKGLTKESDPRVAKYVNTCKERGHYIPHSKGKHLTEEQRRKTSESCKKFYREHPELSPYKLHHSSKESYPEKYFKELFEKENIVGYERDLPMFGYFLDFGFKKQKVDFEVDGSQHWLDKRIVEHDKRRTEKLISEGWTVIRMRWDDWQKMTSDERIKWVTDFKETINSSSLV